MQLRSKQKKLNTVTLGMQLQSKQEIKHCHIRHAATIKIEEIQLGIQLRSKQKKFNTVTLGMQLRSKQKKFNALTLGMQL